MMRKPSPRFLLFSAAVAVLWTAAALVLIPALIQDAYARESLFTPLNSIITGQAEHPVAHYLALWRRVALALTAGALTLTALGMVAWPYRASINALEQRALRGNPVVRTADTVLIGTWIGFAGGLTETLSLTLRFVFSADPREAPSVDALWMAPLAAGLVGSLAGLLLALLLRAWRGLSIHIPIALFSGLALLSVIRGLRLGLFPYAAIFLAAGLATVLMRSARLHSSAFRVFFRRSLPWIAALTLLGAVGIRGTAYWRERAAIAASDNTPPGAPNVLLLILDTVRAEDMGLYGYERNTTPQIERFAATGVTFDRAIVPAPWTLPTHASMFTGLPPNKLSTDFDEALDAAAPTLAEVLQRRGYATGGFVANLVFTTRASGLDRGFAAYRDHPISFRALLASSRWSRKLTHAVRRSVLGERGLLVRRTAEDVNREFLDWIPDDGRPFFAFLNYFDAHDPYETHPPFDMRFSDHPPMYWRLGDRERGKSADDLQEIRNAYDSAIAYLDHHVGALLTALERRGVLQNTIVILTSDHGEHLGERGGMLSHANGLYLPLLRVPLVISFPSRVLPGQRISQPVSVQSIPATVLDLLELSADTLLPGRSLTRLWSAPGDTARAKREAWPPLFSQLTFNTFAHKLDPIRNGLMHSLVRDNLHYIRNGDGREELYDFEADPGEEHDLARTEPGKSRLPEFRRMMDEMLAEDAPAPSVAISPNRRAANSEQRSP